MLQRALQSLVECEKATGPFSWEVVIIDNDSDDNTQSIVNDYRNNLPVRYIHEKNLGLSNARNRGVQEANGSWILWIDDDVTVSPGWLKAYVHAIKRFPDTTVLGGPIAIRFEGSPPPWLDQGVEWVQDAYAGRLPGKFQAAFYSKGPKPYGANFAIRKSATEDTLFDTSLGHHPLRPTMGGEETEFIRKVLSDSPGWWVSEAVVVHHIDKSRQTIEYIRSYYMNAGLLSARDWKDLSALQRLWKPLVAAARVCTNHARYFILCIVKDDKYRVRALRNAAWNWGYVKGCMGILTGKHKEAVMV